MFEFSQDVLGRCSQRADFINMKLLSYLWKVFLSNLTNIREKISSFQSAYLYVLCSEADWLYIRLNPQWQPGFLFASGFCCHTNELKAFNWSRGYRSPITYHFFQRKHSLIFIIIFFNTMLFVLKDCRKFLNQLNERLGDKRR